MAEEEKITKNICTFLIELSRVDNETATLDTAMIYRNHKPGPQHKENGFRVWNSCEYPTRSFLQGQRRPQGV